MNGKLVGACTLTKTAAEVISSKGGTPELPALLSKRGCFHRPSLPPPCRTDLQTSPAHTCTHRHCRWSPGMCHADNRSLQQTKHNKQTNKLQTIASYVSFSNSFRPAIQSEPRCYSKFVLYSPSLHCSPYFPASHWLQSGPRKPLLHLHVTFPGEDAEHWREKGSNITPRKQLVILKSRKETRQRKMATNSCPFCEKKRKT